jgi:uncharacterized protein (TIGR00255 family)
MKSMTGFGVAGCEIDGWEVRAEVQTLNGRFLSTRVHVPDELRSLTPKIEARLKQGFERGTVHCRVSMRSTAGAEGPGVDVDRLEALCRTVREVRQRLGLKGEVMPEWLLAVPGVVGQVSSPGPDADALEKAVLTVTDEAVDQAVQLRCAEGARLAEHLQESVTTMRSLAQRFRERQPEAVEARREALRARITELLVGTDATPQEDQLERELAYLSERADVAEELNRLDSHLQEIDRTLDGDGPVGRKLDFLAQELGRESNTIGAKSADVEQVKLVLELRQEVERMREQVANVE